jgi:hypothetical protein
VRHADAANTGRGQAIQLIVIDVGSNSRDADKPAATLVECCDEDSVTRAASTSLP